MSPRLALAGVIAGLALAAAPAAIATASIATASIAPASADPAPVLATGSLLPGQSTSGTITVGPTDSTVAGLSPYLRAIGLHDTCTSTCSGPALSSLLVLAVRATDGQTWTGTPHALTALTVLPGGTLSAGAPARTFTVTLALPASVTNAAQDRGLSFRFQWGLVSQNGTPVTSGDSPAFPVTGPAGGAGGGAVAPGLHLPFTGADVVAEVVVGASLLACGGLLLAGGRRRLAGRGRREA